MIAFGSIQFFVLVAALTVPALVLGYAQRRIQPWGTAATLLVVLALLANSPRQLALLTGFVLTQVVLMAAHLHVVTTHGRKVTWERRLVIVAGLIPLAVVKLAGVAGDSQLTFLGVSYLTFRSIQVLLEISDGLITEMRVRDYLYFLLFFPTISSGPIDRSRRFLSDLAHAPSREEYARMVLDGLRWIALGAAYKFVAAAALARWLTGVKSGMVETIKYMYLYGFDLFFDFAGYSLMAVGVSYLFGVRTPVNFRMPFLAVSMKDFWNRWHISLSFWFRDYVYGRLLMAMMRRKVLTDRVKMGQIALLVNMSLMGLWHGTGINFLAYGLYHGALLVLNDLYERRLSWHRRFQRAVWYRLVSMGVTFHLVMFGFLIFSGRLVR